MAVDGNTQGVKANTDDIVGLKANMADLESAIQDLLRNGKSAIRDLFNARGGVEKVTPFAPGNVSSVPSAKLNMSS